MPHLILFDFTTRTIVVRDASGQSKPAPKHLELVGTATPASASPPSE